MPLKVTVKYWDNRNYGFGHIAVEVVDRQDHSKKHYISWAMTNDPSLDLKKHGKPPIDIVLPDIEGLSFADFEAYFKETIYYLSPESMEYIQFLRYGEGSTDTQKAREKAHKLSNQAKKQLRNYWDSYNITTKNCGHCVLDVLNFVGYIHKQSSKFGLRPYTVAQIACKIAKTELYSENNKKKFLDNSAIDNEYKLHLLISNLIEILQVEKAKQSSDHFTLSSSNLEKDIATLREIEIYDNKDVNCVKKIVTKTDRLTTSIAIKEIKDCFHLIPEKTFLQARVLSAIENLKDNILFKSANISSKDINKIMTLADNFISCLNKYVKATWTKEQFEEESRVVLKEIKPLLLKYEVCHESLNKLKNIFPKSTTKKDVFSLFFKHGSTDVVNNSNENFASEFYDQISQSSIEIS